MQSGFYPGSFDPPTLGHVDILIRAMRLVDRLVVGIGTNANKTAIFTVQERVDMLHACLDGAAQVAKCELKILAFDGLIVDAARIAKAPLIIRGLRHAGDFEAESRMMAMNQRMAAEIETICLTTAPETGFISSTLVRQIAQMGGDFSPFVPSEIIDMIKSKY